MRVKILGKFGRRFLKSHRSELRESLPRHVIAHSVQNIKFLGKSITPIFCSWPPRFGPKTTLAPRSSLTNNATTLTFQRGQFLVGRYKASDFQSSVSSSFRDFLGGFENFRRRYLGNWTKVQRQNFTDGARPRVERHT